MDTDLRALRRKMLEVAVESGEGHLPSSYSVTEILWALYDGVLRGSPDEPNRDRFILSKGHAALALYAVLGAKGLIPANWENEYCRGGMTFAGHPERDTSWGIEATTGSLGHGGPMSVGLAVGMKIAGIDASVYCLLGDQELNEGSCYEAMLLAAHHKLDNLVWIIDDNHSADRSLSMGSIPQKFLAFGWHAEWASGHSVTTLQDFMRRRHPGKPSCIVAETIKGYGIEEFEREPNRWHHALPDLALAGNMMERLA